MDLGASDPELHLKDVPSLRRSVVGEDSAAEVEGGVPSTKTGTKCSFWGQAERHCSRRGDIWKGASGLCVELKVFLPVSEATFLFSK